ncbi:unnamed protein product [Cyprideis torosa]|uniref:Uncharacterized protein n=1 Tax=Cyprideis torosa TaxID=163714 RepID=A0A7R8ZJK9_9CRUS|nr:unnamed protein product [Cyprideis torosa]CAG0887283.1 unnamed protein product [Cyprideis torosa]
MEQADPRRWVVLREVWTRSGGPFQDLASKYGTVTNVLYGSPIPITTVSGPFPSAAQTRYIHDILFAFEEEEAAVAMVEDIRRQGYNIRLLCDRPLSDRTLSVEGLAIDEVKNFIDSFKTGARTADCANLESPEVGTQVLANMESRDDVRAFLAAFNRSRRDDGRCSRGRSDDGRCSRVSFHRAAKEAADQCFRIGDETQELNANDSLMDFYHVAFSMPLDSQELKYVVWTEMQRVRHPIFVFRNGPPMLGLWTTQKSGLGVSLKAVPYQGQLPAGDFVKLEKNIEPIKASATKDTLPSGFRHRDDIWI